MTLVNLWKAKWRIIGIPVSNVMYYQVLRIWYLKKLLAQKRLRFFCLIYWSLGWEYLVL